MENLSIIKNVNQPLPASFEVLIICGCRVMFLNQLFSYPKAIFESLTSRQSLSLDAYQTLYLLNLNRRSPGAL